MDQKPDQKPQTDRPGTPDGPEGPKKGSQEEKILTRGKQGMIFAVLVAGSLLASTYPLPWTMLGGLLGIVGLVWAVKYFIAAIRAGKAGNWIVLGAIGTLICIFQILQSLGTLVIWPVQAEYEECVRSALTEQASHGCVADQQSGLNELYEGLTGNPLPGYEPAEETTPGSGTDATEGPEPTDTTGTPGETAQA